ncbi:hypothetical protein Trydic_g19275 [Trypoxylus dichotomus]
MDTISRGVGLYHAAQIRCRDGKASNSRSLYRKNIERVSTFAMRYLESIFSVVAGTVNCVKPWKRPLDDLNTVLFRLDGEQDQRIVEIGGG